MGERGVALMLADLEKNLELWFLALAKITSDDERALLVFRLIRGLG